jgi:hypothetical protein
VASRLRPGEVRDAIRAYLKEIGREATISEIHAVVNERIGSTVPASSVRSSLQLSDLFRRVSRGRYQLAQR